MVAMAVCAWMRCVSLHTTVLSYCVLLPYCPAALHSAEAHHPTQCVACMSPNLMCACSNTVFSRTQPRTRMLVNLSRSLSPHHPQTFLNMKPCLHVASHVRAAKQRRCTVFSYHAKQRRCTAAETEAYDPGQSESHLAFP